MSPTEALDRYEADHLVSLSVNEAALFMLGFMRGKEDES